MYVPKIAPQTYRELQEIMCDKAIENDACPEDEETDCYECILCNDNIEQFVSWYRQERAVQQGSEVLNGIR